MFNSDRTDRSASRRRITPAKPGPAPSRRAAASWLFPQRPFVLERKKKTNRSSNTHALLQVRDQIKSLKENINKRASTEAKGGLAVLYQLLRLVTISSKSFRIKALFLVKVSKIGNVEFVARAENERHKITIRFTDIIEM